MSDIDLPLRSALDALVPEPRRNPSWQDVLRRAEPRLWRRPLMLAVAAVLLVLATAAGVTAALGGFDSWLSGNPGKPAPAAEQQRFESANGRTWAAFPRDTKLRELIRTTVGGKTYVLFGFRSGDTLCLKLRAVTLGHSTEPACTPESTVAHATSPIVVVNGDFAFENRHAHDSAEFSSGIVADGVSRVDIRAVDGTHRATIGGNAYLWVENEPNTGNRVLSISARGPNGKTSIASLGTTFGGYFGIASTARRPPGPTRVEAPVAHPTIGWSERRVKPDPLSDIVVSLTGQYCLVVEQGRARGTGCSDRSDFFSQGPLNVMMEGGGGVQAAVLAGAAANGVARITMFDANGLRIRVPLKDNLFALRAAANQFPVRLVAYNSHGDVVGTQVFGNLVGGPSVPASAFRDLAPARSVRGPSGTIATLRIGRDTRGFRCWRVDFSTGQSPRGCIQISPTGSWVTLNLVQPAGRDLFVIGQTRPPVATVELHFQDGRVVQLHPTRRLFVAAIPRAYLRSERQLAFAVGYDARHRVIQRQGFVFRVSP